HDESGCNCTECQFFSNIYTGIAQEENDANYDMKAVCISCSSPSAKAHHDNLQCNLQSPTKSPRKKSRGKKSKERHKKIQETTLNQDDFDFDKRPTKKLKIRSRQSENFKEHYQPTARTSDFDLVREMDSSGTSIKSSSKSSASSSSTSPFRTSIRCRIDGCPMVFEGN